MTESAQWGQFSENFSHCSSHSVCDERWGDFNRSGKAGAFQQNPMSTNYLTDGLPKTSLKHHNPIQPEKEAETLTGFNFFLL